MKAQFEIDWLGGPAERRMRRRRPGIDDLPWGTLSLPEEEAAAQREVWTDGCFREYASAAAFSALTTALLEAGAPIDLVAMSADFVVDEMVHVELNARIAAELGGAAPYLADLEKVSPWTDPALPAIERATELALTTSCVGEALSVPSLGHAAKSAGHPLVRAVLRRIVRDEGPHARLGWLVLDWAGARVDRARLAQVARDRIAAYAPLWACEECENAAILRRAVRDDIARPLAARGIEV